VSTVVAGSLTYSRLTDRLLQGGGGGGVVTVVVLAVAARAAKDSFGCRISYRNSGMMGTRTQISAVIRE
jgi:hypothetical protein